MCYIKSNSCAYIDKTFSGERQMLLVQVVEDPEPSFMIHQANAYEEGEEVVLLAIGWGPEIVRQSAVMPGSGVFGTFKGGEYTSVPVTSLWSHRSAAAMSAGLSQRVKALVSHQLHACSQLCNGHIDGTGM